MHLRRESGPANHLQRIRVVFLSARLCRGVGARMAILQEIVATSQHDPLRLTCVFWSDCVAGILFILCVHPPDAWAWAVDMFLLARYQPRSRGARPVANRNHVAELSPWKFGGINHPPWLCIVRRTVNPSGDVLTVHMFSRCASIG